METTKANEENEWTTLPLRPNTKRRIDEWGKKGQTYDEIVNQLLDIAEDKQMDAVLAAKPTSQGL